MYNDGGYKDVTAFIKFLTSNGRKHPKIAALLKKLGGRSLA